MAIIVALVIFLSSFTFIQCEGITAEITEDLCGTILDAAKTGIDGAILNASKVFNPSLNLFYKATQGYIGTTSSL